MSRTRTIDRLSEIDERVVAAAEAHLDRLMSIEPSPEFAAKVRARISGARAARGWRSGWVGLALASAAALVIAFTLRSDPAERDRAGTSARPPHQDVVLSAATSAMRGAVSVAHMPTPPAAPKRARIAAHRLGEPEVLIDASLADTIRRLAISTRNTPLDDTAPDGSTQPASEVSVPSVVVKPLTVPELVLKPADQNGGR